MDDYLPIAEHGLIGDLHSVALVGTDGTIDWYCCPRFDSPSVFGAILDKKKGGHWRVSPQHADYTSKQLYFPDTNVLITRFLTRDGVGEVQDFMPVGEHLDGAHRQRIVRRVVSVRGPMRFHMHMEPRFNYARDDHEVSLHEHGAIFGSRDLTMGLESTVPLKVVAQNGVSATFSLNENESATFLLERVPNDFVPRHHHHDETREMFDGTVAYWRKWLSQSSYRGRWREMVNRSALTLKLLTYNPTGAIVASPTTSLPEQLGGPRNWDYRYTWIRDAAFSLYALLRLGFTDEAQAFMGWLTDRFREGKQRDVVAGPLQIMYGIDGRHEMPEETLDHLEGYRGSRPVRVGNGACEQLQLDIYGELMDSVYLYDKYGSPMAYDSWGHVRRVIDWVADNWMKPDDGIWEVRGGQQQFIYSKVQCWVALDRAIRLATKRSLPLDRARLLAERDRIYEAVMTHGWDAERRTFVQYFGTDALDAANLIMPLVFFISPTDPRMIGTINRTMAELVSDSLVYRYEMGRGAGDGLAGGEGTFNMCTFWLVEALTRAGRLEEARFIFEKMLTYANHLGLYAEETGPSGEALGNFPQAFTHMGLISAAFNLDRRLGGAA